MKVCKSVLDYSRGALATSVLETSDEGKTSGRYSQDKPGCKESAG